MVLQREEHPIVVIGTGLAGALAALALARRGREVNLVGPSTEPIARPAATSVSYGGMAGLLPALRWRRLQFRHGPMGWHPSRLVLHRAGGETAPFAPFAPLLPFSRVDGREMAAVLPKVLAKAGVRLQTALVEELVPLAGGRWRLRTRRTGDPAGNGEILAGQVLLAAGAGCRDLWSALPQRLRSSWAGVLLLPSNPGGSIWLERARQGWVVQPACWRRPELERRVDEHPGERWIVDAGLAPWGDGAVLGQISLVHPGLQQRPPPDPALMEQWLREGLARLDQKLAAVRANYHQVQVPFCPDGLPLVGPVAGVRNLWIFTGFTGAFSVVPAAAERLAKDMLVAKADSPAGR